MNYTTKYYQTKDSLTSPPLALFSNRYKNQTIWGTMYGFYAYNSKIDRFEPYHQLNEKLKAGHDIAFWLQEMPDGKIWVLRDENDLATIGYMDPDGRGKYNWITAPFRRIPEMKMSSCYIEPSGITWIFGNEGLYRYDLTKDKKNYKQPFNCLVRKVTIANDSTVFGGNEISKTLEIDYKYNSLKFEFAAPFFDGEEKTLYSYQLAGYDTAWSVYSRRTEKEYTNLSEGTYTFRVKAKNMYNVESETGIYTLTILPPWYRTWLSYAIYLIAFVAFIVLILKLYTRRLLVQKESLEQIVKERTAEIETQKEEILTQSKELRAKNEKLIEMDHFKEGMTGMIVHDLKNPLNTILSLTKEQELQQAGEQMLNMVLNILDVQKFENAQVKIQPIDFDFQSCLNDVLQQTKFLFERKSIQIFNKVKPECVVKGDYELIHRVSINLLSNAIKYTPNNGIITIRCEQDPENLNNVKLSFIDTGTGIPPDKLHLIFDKFMQIEAKDSGSVRSTGLGLTCL